jgi:5'-nucleotidase
MTRGVPARPLILVTNDDGIESPGLRAAAEAVADLGDVLVVAPSQQQSSMGRSLWGDRDDRLHAREFSIAGRMVTAYACNGAPALTVLHAIHALCSERPPALLVAGINYGENLGCNVTLSGTVGACLEAASLGVPALAVSLQTDIELHYRYGDVNWSAARHFARRFAKRLLAERLPPDADVLNVNVPRNATEETPCKLTHLSRQSYFSIRMESPHSESRIRDGQVGVYLDRSRVEEGSDIQALAYEQVVTVSPLSLNLTSRTPRESLAVFMKDGMP